MNKKVIIIVVVLLVALIVIGIVLMSGSSTPTPEESSQAISDLAAAAASETPMSEDQATEAATIALANIPADNTTATQAVSALVPAATSPAPAPAAAVIAAANTAQAGIVADPCSGYTSTSKGISQDCYNKIWKDVGCTNAGHLAKPVVAEWVKTQSYESLLGDFKYWATSQKDENRIGCYGTDRTKWPIV